MVEMSEEVLQAQKRGRSRIIVLAAVTAVIGGFMGFASGSANERSKQDKTALASAERLSKDVEASSAEIGSGGLVAASLDLLAPTAIVVLEPDAS